MSSQAPATDDSDARERTLQRQWWLRVLMTLQSPRYALQALRDDSDEAAGARQEPALALLILSGIAAVLSFSGATRTLLDNPERDGAVVAVVVFLGGALYGTAGYWLGGLALHLGVRGARGDGTYRQARHLLAYGLAPLAASLLVWAVRLVALRGDNFRSGGSDEGSVHWVLAGIQFAFLAWAVALLVLGVREVYRFTLIRSLGALLLSLMALGGLGLVALLLTAGV